MPGVVPCSCRSPQRSQHPDDIVYRFCAAFKRGDELLNALGRNGGQRDIPKCREQVMVDITAHVLLHGQPILGKYACLPLFKELPEGDCVRTAMINTLRRSGPFLPADWHQCRKIYRAFSMSFADYSQEINDVPATDLNAHDCASPPNNNDVVHVLYLKRIFH